MSWSPPDPSAPRSKARNPVVPSSPRVTSAPPAASANRMQVAAVVVVGDRATAPRRPPRARCDRCRPRSGRSPGPARRRSPSRRPRRRRPRRRVAPSRSATRAAVDGKRWSGVAVGTITMSRSAAATPAASRIRSDAIEGQVAGGLVGGGEAPLADAGAADDPLVAGVHPPGDVGVGHHRLGGVGAERREPRAPPAAVAGRDHAGAPAAAALTRANLQGRLARDLVADRRRGLALAQRAAPAGEAGLEDQLVARAARRGGSGRARCRRTARACPPSRGSASAASAPVWARASTMITPGRIGLPGKWPAKNAASGSTRQRARADSPGASARTSSTKRKGGRCGRRSVGSGRRSGTIGRIVAHRPRRAPPGRSAILGRAVTPTLRALLCGLVMALAAAALPVAGPAGAQGAEPAPVRVIELDGSIDQVAAVFVERRTRRGRGRRGRRRGDPAGHARRPVGDARHRRRHAGVRRSR